MALLPLAAEAVDATGAAEAVAADPSGAVAAALTKAGAGPDQSRRALLATLRSAGHHPAVSVPMIEMGWLDPVRTRCTACIAMQEQTKQPPPQHWLTRNRLPPPIASELQAVGTQLAALIEAELARDGQTLGYPPVPPHPPCLRTDRTLLACGRS